MNAVANLKISTRLMGAFGVLLALLLAVAAGAVVQMGTMRSASHAISEHWLPGVELINQMNTKALDFRRLELRHMLAANEDGMTAAEKLLAAALVEFGKDRDRYAKQIDTAEEKALYDGFAADWAQYLQIHKNLVATARRYESDQARAMLDGESQKVFNSASAKLLKLIELNHDGAMAAGARADSAFATARNTTIGVALAAVLLVVGAGLWISRSITLPLGKAVAHATRIAEGDLSGRISVDTHDETGALLAALQRMQAYLVDTVSSVRSNSESVATASAQIAQGNQDLSQRTEQQASALQQTSATMEQLGSTVRNNTDNAKQANQLAQSASGVAAQGGAVVTRVVDTMKGINDSSKKIADIISVIDGIAFQTNILALNAAVEAARAGEQGRGFAVVAAEVRSLAQRSAAAAKEIKTLIGHSVEQVSQGTALVDQAGQTMTEIVSSIRRVSDIVAEISAASVEQSTGVTQVGEAVTQMDRTTQQNAALVEESAAAAESLKLQAQQLVQAVAVFKLAAREAAPA